MNKKKHILFIVYHPVETHIYYNISKLLSNDNFDVKFAIFESEGIIEKITRTYQISYFHLGKAIKNKYLRVLNIPIIMLKFIIIYLRFKPQVIFSATSPYAGLSALLFKKAIIGWSDTETATFNNNISKNLFSSILLPTTFYETINSNKVIRYNGYKELTYLHPKYFSPDNSVFSELNLNQHDTIVLMRFSALNAMHDIGLKSEAISNDEKILLFIRNIEQKFNAKVFISVTERDLDRRFDKYKLTIAPERYIHLLSFCTLYIGEGTTTAAEAGVLGVPWINIQKTTRGYLIDQEENYGLGFRTDDIDYAFQKAEEFLQDDDIKIKWRLKRDKLLQDKIDVTAFLSWFIANYPESYQIMKENPGYQYKFK